MTIQTTTPKPSGLTPEEQTHYDREGYCIIPRPVLPEARFEGLRDYFDQILREKDPQGRPEALDVPHFVYPRLFEWVLDPAVLDLVEPILGPDLALFSTHFICKPQGDGRRVPWHEDSYYWKGMIDPMQVVTVWLALDPSTVENGCMRVVPRTHRTPDSEYEEVDSTLNIFPTEIRDRATFDARAVPIELAPNQASLHDAHLIHGSPPNRSALRRCGYTMRFISTRVRFDDEKFGHFHQIYLARGRDHAGNRYADPTRAHEDLAANRKIYKKAGTH